MNIGTSIRVCLAKINKTRPWLAGEMGITEQALGRLARSQHSTTKTAERLATVFGKKTSEFIAEGELDD